MTILLKLIIFKHFESEKQKNKWKNVYVHPSQMMIHCGDLVNHCIKIRGNFIDNAFLIPLFWTKNFRFACDLSHTFTFKINRPHPKMFVHKHTIHNRSSVDPSFVFPFHSIMQFQIGNCEKCLCCFFFWGVFVFEKVNINMKHSSVTNKFAIISNVCGW